MKILTRDGGYGKNCHTIPNGNGHGKITALCHGIHWVDKMSHDMHEGKIVMQFK
jgi:hypothetical protein